MSIKTYLRRGISYVLHGQTEKRIISDLHIHYFSPAHKLEGKKIIVTGASRGLGYAMAKRFVDEGAQVLITGRNEESLKKVSEELHCFYQILDMNDVKQFEPFIIKAADQLHGLDILVNNAGISLHEKDYNYVTPESFDSQINTNLRGPFFLTQQFVQYLQNENKQGSVLFISSETGTTVDLRPYGWTKAAINSMVQGLAYRFRNEGIRINAICPGVTASDMTGYKADGNLYEAGIHNRIYLPEEIAETAVFILSETSKLLNGQILVCNEGRTINARWK